MTKQRLRNWVAVVAALAVSVIASADDRDFLREVAAAPNLIFILDTSSSMVASPEVTTAGDPAVPTAIEGALVPSAMVPGGGDDPYSRMGIAKRVLREFLDDVGEANIALAGYAQAQPSDGSNGVPQKHWVYEARAQDRFHMVEATYAYRMGYAENHAGILLDVPADIMKNRLIGYKPYFTPGSDITDRFGPLNVYDSGYVDYTMQNPTEGLPDIDVLAPFDLMPIYFGNCFVDNQETPSDPSDDVTVCGDNVFPFYDSGIRDVTSGDLLPSEWYYGEADEATEDYPGCDPNESTWDLDGDGTPDLGACESEWEETSGGDLIQYQRRVRLEIPTTYGGNPNHFYGVDGSDTPVGNTQVADGGAEDYDLDGFADPDYDGDETNDWMLYVNSVEENRFRTCVAGASYDTPTPTLTPTPTPTETYTPTPTPTPVCRVTVENLHKKYDYPSYSNYMSATITNGHASPATITRIYWDWASGLRKWAYNQWLRICTDGATTQCGSSYEELWDDGSGSYSVVPYTGKYARPLEATGPPYVGEYTSGNPDPSEIGAGVTTYWWAYIYDNAQWEFDGVYEICFDFLIPGDAPGGGDLTCPDVCAVSYEGSFGTPTPTPTITPSPTTTSIPTATRTNTPFGGAPTSTPTRTPTSGGVGPTNTPFALPTSTPTPWPTPTNPPTPTNTPPPTATPVS